MNSYLIGLGSNTGNKKNFLETALMKLSEQAELKKKSSIYRTSPVGYMGQPDFYNMAALYLTQKSPEEMLEICLAAEETLGRPRIRKSGFQRTIDLDILACGDTVLETGKLTIPHPEMHRRLFVLIPLKEIIPGFIHPVTGEGLDNMIAGAEKDEQTVEKIEF